MLVIQLLENLLLTIIKKNYAYRAVSIVAVIIVLLSLIFTESITESSQPPFFNPDYVSPPPAEISYLVLDMSPRGTIVDFRSSVLVYSFEYGPFFIGLYAFYQEWEGCVSDGVNGPGWVSLDTVCSHRIGFNAIGNPLFIQGVGWVQSIDIYGVSSYSNISSNPNLKKIDIMTHQMGDILIPVYVNAPGRDSVISVKVYRGGEIVYSSSKTLIIPSEWTYSPHIMLRIDFGPLTFKKAGEYIIAVDVNSGGITSSGRTSYIKPGPITINVDDPYGSSWSISWRDGSSGVRTGIGSDSWTLYATSTVFLEAKLLQTPSGYTCSITPSSSRAVPGDTLTFKVVCASIIERTKTLTLTKKVTETELRTVTRELTVEKVDRVTTTIVQYVSTVSTLTVTAMESILNLFNSTISILTILILSSLIIVLVYIVRRRSGASRILGKVRRLEELYREGKVSEEAYRRLREEYEEERKHHLSRS